MSAMVGSSVEGEFREQGMRRGANDSPRHLGLMLACLVTVSLAVRIAALAYYGTGGIESEGAEYARIAENLRHGVGYVGIVTPGAQLNFNPLLPLLIAGVSFLTGSYELAARIVVLVFGALLPLPVFGIARRLFQWRAGVIAGILTCLHPLLLNLSFSVFSEGPYITLVITAVYLTIRALSQPSGKLWLLVGAAFGLSWLCRAEATAMFAVAVLSGVIVSPCCRGVRWRNLAAACGVFIVTVSPEVIFLYLHTGKVRLEMKSGLFFDIGERVLVAEREPRVVHHWPAGQREIPDPAFDGQGGYPTRWEGKWAFYGVDDSLRGMSFAMRPHAEVIRETRVGFKDKIVLLARGLRLNAPEFFREVSSDWFGAPLLPCLALLGALRRPWRGPTSAGRSFLVLSAAAAVAATFFAFWSEARYYFILIPFMCVWAANGVVEAGLWTMSSSLAAGWKSLARPFVSQGIVPGALVLIMVVMPVKAARGLYLFRESARPGCVDRVAGRWLGGLEKGPVRIMDLSIPLAYHAGAEFSYFPYCSGDTALRYLDSAKIDYVVLRKGMKFTRYYEEWLIRGIQDDRAERLSLPSVPGAEKLTIFRWHGR